MTKIIQRHDTAANWASANPVLAQGEMGIETDTRKFKFGDGATAWVDLAYASSEGGGGVSDYNELTNKPKINNVELSGNNTSTDLGLQDVFSTKNPINMLVETVSPTKNVAIDKAANVITVSSTQTAGTPNADNKINISAKNNLDKEGIVFYNYISLPIDGNTVYVNNTNNIFLGLYASDGSFIPKFVFGNNSSSSDGAFYVSSITNSGNYKVCQAVNLALSSSVRNSTLYRAIRIDKANNTVYLSNVQTGDTKPCILTNEIHINALQECTTVMLVSSQANLDYGLQNTKSYWIGALQYDSTEFKIPTASEAASLLKKYPDDAIVTRYLNLNVDNTTIKINESGALEAIAPANMITTDNIASDATISTMNSAVEAAQSDITTLSTTVESNTTKIEQVKMYPKFLYGSGKIVDASGDTTEGVGNFTLTLYNNGKCRIDFVFKITTAGTAASNFNWGISTALLKAINSDIPNITVTYGGYAVYLNSNGTKDDSLNNYGGHATGSSDGSRWTFGRIYQATGEYGGWNSAKFPVGTFVYGCAIGTFNINEV